MKKNKKNPNYVEAEQLDLPFYKEVKTNTPQKTQSGIEENIKTDACKSESPDYVSRLRRDCFGLLPNTKYVFKEDGRVDWRAMIPSKYLVPNKDKYPQGTDLSKINVEEEDDSKLLVLLNGFRYVAQLRGFRSLTKSFNAAQPDFVSCSCKITLLPNYETDLQEFEYESEADAHIGNCDGFGKKFLTTIAGNRAEVRAIRAALGIEILGKDEISSEALEDTKQKTDISPIRSLEKLLGDNNISFERFKNRMIKDEVVGADIWESITDIPSDQIFTLISKVRSLLSKKVKD